MNDDFIVKPTPKTKIENTPKPVEEPAAEPVTEDLPAEEHALGEESVMDQPISDDAVAKPPKKKRRNPKQWFLALTKKQKILFCVACVLLLAGIGFGVYKLTQDTPATTATKKAAKKAAAKPTTEASRLSGVQISPELNKRGTTGVMVENSEAARPQSGLLDAGVIFEAKAEGGITRFLVIYQEGQPGEIGPVRSVRPHYVDWVQGFDAPLAHAGGSADGLAKVKADRIRDLDHSVNGSTFDRVDFKVAPHNLYTSAAKLDAAKASRGFTTSTFTGFARKKEKALAKPTAATIDLSITSSIFSVHYDYDKATNSYKRSVGGAPHTDRVTGTQLSPKVVVANVMINNRGAGSSSNYVTLGSGKTFIFQDGGMTEGTWEKPSSTSQIVYKDARGNVLKLNPGQTWISAIEAPTDVTFKP